MKFEIPISITDSASLDSIARLKAAGVQRCAEKRILQSKALRAMSYIYANLDFDVDQLDIVGNKVQMLVAAKDAAKAESLVNVCRFIYS